MTNNKAQRMFKALKQEDSVGAETKKAKYQLINK